MLKPRKVASRSLLSALLVAPTLLLAWLLNFATGWLPRLDSEEKAAFAALRSDATQVSGKRNAFAALYSFDRDVPEAEWQAVADADVAAFALHPYDRRDSKRFEMLANSPYPPHPKIASEHPGLCPPWTSGCLERVRGHLAATRKEIARGQGWLRRGERLSEFDYYRHLLPPRIDTPFGVNVGGYSQLLLAATAVEHIDGHSVEALSKLCRAAATWRQLRTHNDFLLVDAIAVSIISGTANLYADILAELPADFTPPCASAFAPLADAEFNQCPVFAGKFRMWEESFRIESGIDRLGEFNVAGGVLPSVGDVLKLAMYRERNLRVIAKRVSRWCSPEHQQRASQRSAIPLSSVANCSGWERAIDPFACPFGSYAKSDYDKYYVRLLDLDGRLRLLNSALLLRGAAPADALTLFAARPAGLQSLAHDVSIDTSAGVLRMRPHGQAKGEVWEVRYAKPAAAIDALPAD